MSREDGVRPDVHTGPRGTLKVPWVMGRPFMDCAPACIGSWDEHFSHAYQQALEVGVKRTLSASVPATCKGLDRAAWANGWLQGVHDYCLKRGLREPRDMRWRRDSWSREFSRGKYAASQGNSCEPIPGMVQRPLDRAAWVNGWTQENGGAAWTD